VSRPSDPINRVSLWLRGYLVAEFVAANLWTQFSQLQWGIVLLLALTCCLELRPGWFVPHGDGPAEETARPLDEIARRLFPPGLTWSSVLLGLAVCVPVFLHIVMTAREEFPFGGDEGYEVSASRQFALVLKSALPWLLGFAVVFGAIVRRYTRLTVSLLFAAMFVVSFRFPIYEAVARYPGTFYFLATPFNVVSEALHWKRAFFANHIVNALSVPAWLFVLRPILLRRWPDLLILPLAAALFAQKEVVYLFGGGQAIEPWAFVLLLLAIEALVTLPDAASWFAYFLIGCSFMTKEQSVFLFPLIWFVAVLRTGRGWIRQHLAAGLVVLAPFAVYYVIRRHADVVRQISFHEIGSAWQLERLWTWGHRVLGEFGAAGIIVPAAIAVYAIAGFWLLRDRRLRQVHAVLVVAAAGLLALNFTEDQSLLWIAYSRFMLYPYFLCALLLLPLTVVLLRQNRTSAVVAMAAVIVALQAGPLAASLSLDLRPDYARNSLEWARVPIYYPVRALVEQMQQRPSASRVRVIRVITPGLDPIVAPVVYPDFRRRYAIEPSSMATPEESCACKTGQAVFLGVQYRSGMALDEAADVTMPAVTSACVQRMHATCEDVLKAYHETGDLVGALGIPAR
jgi:hypothetical protein